MTHLRLIPLLLLILSGCTEEPTPDEAEKAAVQLQEDNVKARQMSIEEAAEEATKIIEADARQEADAAKTDVEAPN